MQMEKKLAAASTRRAMPDMVVLPVFELLVDGRLLKRTPSMQPLGVKNIPYSGLMPASWITLRQRSSSP
jgi:hypothetical protein